MEPTTSHLCPPNTDVTVSAIYKCHCQRRRVGRRAGVELGVAKTPTGDEYAEVPNRSDIGTSRCGGKLAKYPRDTGESVILGRPKLSILSP
jgi:hypothetical protein